MSIEVFNNLGQKVESLAGADLTAGEYSYEIGGNVSLYPSGIYLVRTVVNGKVSIAKIIKN